MKLTWDMARIQPQVFWTLSFCSFIPLHWTWTSLSLENWDVYLIKGWVAGKTENWGKAIFPNWKLGKLGKAPRVIMDFQNDGGNDV